MVLIKDLLIFVFPLVQHFLLHGVLPLGSALLITYFFILQLFDHIYFQVDVMVFG